jgi:hypothetical protein
MRWVQEPQAWSLVNRVSPWSGDTGGVGEPMPPGTTAMAASDAPGRRFLLWLYCPENELRLVIPFDRVAVEGGANTLPTGRIDTNGPPVVSWHGGQIKLFGKLWRGPSGDADALYRVYTWCRYQ